MDDTYLNELQWGINARWWPKERNRREARYIDSLLKFISRRTKCGYSRILDLPCGTGRLDRYLRELGYVVYGVDNNPSFIEKANRTHRGYSKNYIRADMRSFNLPERFDAILHWS
jgi:2-polyprenyl-3-methyl-5-hydroxy-6-metoxy-1,4-benzoquinol methylase